ncbi:MAG: hypothetical protein WCJ30_01275, partial [Deltaproteobacteria bacterium]
PPRLLEAARSTASAPAAPAPAAPDAPLPARVTSLRRLDVPGLPPDIDVVAYRDEADRWHAAAVEPAQISLGLAGAERIHTRLLARGESPTPLALARIVGALLYYPWPVFDGQRWLTTPDGFTPGGAGATPQLAPRPAGLGRALVFSYAIPEGSPGAGIHLANIRITDSGYLIDAAPNPERR